MHRNRPSHPRSHQHGTALLVFLLITGIAALSILLNRLALRSAIVNDQETMQTMALAKEAIIGWSASKASTPGMLPCPEDTTLIGTITEGQALNNCNLTTLQVGRLPWRTLGLPDLRDQSGEKLWYAISPGFRAPPINSNSPALLTVDGVANSAVAIIFSPGPALAGQNRTPPTATSPPVVAQYLDGINNTGTGSFISTGAPGLFNDRVLTITRSNLFSVINRRILSDLRGDALTGGLIMSYSANGNNYPWAAADSLGVPLASSLNPYLPHTALLLISSVSTVMLANNWYPLVTYNVNASRQQVTLSINNPEPVSCTVTPGKPLCQ